MAFKKLTFKMAIRAKCLQCSAGSYKEVTLCPCTSCALYPFRLGKAPKEPINALDLLVFPDDPSSTIFSIRSDTVDKCN